MRSNGQGIAALMALGMLDELGAGDNRWTAPTTVHLQIEAMKLALRRPVYQYNADIDHMRSRQPLLHARPPAQRAAPIDPARAGDPG